MARPLRRLPGAVRRRRRRASAGACASRSSCCRKAADFHALHAQRNAPNLGELINIALEAIEEANKEKLEGVFRNIDFNSEAALGRTEQRNERLQHLLNDFAEPALDLRPSRVGDLDVIGNAYEYLIGKFAAGAGKKAGEFYTPPEVSTLLAKLVDPQPGERICDPACGSGSLLIKCAHEVGERNVRALRPGEQRRHLGAGQDEHVPPRRGATHASSGATR